MRIAGSRGVVEIFPFDSEPKLRLSHGEYSNLQDVTPAELPEGSTDIVMKSSNL